MSVMSERHAEHPCGCTEQEGVLFPCNAHRRDYSAMYGPDGKCVVCGTPAYAEAAEFHQEQHLAECTAVVSGSTESGSHVWRVVPTSSFPPIVDKLVLPTKRVDSRLRALARAALKRIRAAQRTQEGT